MMGAVAEFERALILERQREGIAKAKARGVYKGRKPSLTTEQAHTLRARAAAGESKAKLAKEFGVHRDTVYSYLNTRPALPRIIGRCPTSRCRTTGGRNLVPPRRRQRQHRCDEQPWGPVPEPR